MKQFILSCVLSVAAIAPSQAQQTTRQLPVYLDTDQGRRLTLIERCRKRWLRNAANRTIKTADDVAQYLDLPLLGSVPDLKDLQKNMQEKDKKPGLAVRMWRKIWKA